MTYAECELIEAALAFDATNFYLHGQPETCSCVLCQLRKAAAKVRDERKPKPRYEAHPGIDKHHTEAGIYDTAEGRRLLRTEVADRLNLAALNATPPQ